MGQYCEYSIEYDQNYYQKEKQKQHFLVGKKVTPDIPGQFLCLHFISL